MTKPATSSVAPPTKPSSPPPAPPSPIPVASSLPSLPPPILLEGDSAPPAPLGGPGHRYALAPSPGGIETSGESVELPATYGTKRLLLVARDPHWVYAHWDFTDAQIMDANRKSASGALTLRIRAGSAASEITVEQGVHPESRNWFVHVPRGGSRYVAEIGYYDAARRWTGLATSAPTLTPRGELSEETWVCFETLPFDLPMGEIVALVKEAIADPTTPLLEAIQHLHREGALDLPVPTRARPGSAGAPSPGDLEWTPAQERALAEVVSMDEVRRIWLGSLEITELLKRQLQRGLSSAAAARIGGASERPGGAVENLASLSSPFGGPAPGTRGFWFNVNAELIVYGATDPHAAVTIGGRPIRLRPDGTFSYRFALPDGDYGLPIAAKSPDGLETREADLAFGRTSRYRGDVAAHPQDPALNPPSPENVG